MALHRHGRRGGLRPDLPQPVVSKHAVLDRCAMLRTQTYGEAVDATTLIPHMLEAFMAGDRGFRRGGRAVATENRKVKAGI